MRENETLAGRVVLVCGAGSGLGLAICKMLEQEGASVVAADGDEARARETMQQLPAGARRACCIELDVGSEAQVARALDMAVGRYGKLDAIVNNAGTDVTATLDDLDLAGWEGALRTNLTGPFLIAKAAKRRLAPRGQIVNIASFSAGPPRPDGSAFHASKWGLVGLSRALHAELREMGLRVSAVISAGMSGAAWPESVPGSDGGGLQDFDTIARTVRFVLTQPDETAVPEVMVLPMKETSWP